MRPEPRLTSPWLRAFCLAASALVLSAVAWAPMLSAYPLTQGGDGPFYQRVLEATKVSLFRYHELPLWNAYECGGVPLWDNPQSIAGSPIILATLPFSTTFAMALWYVLHSALGWIGMWLFCRDELRLTRAAAFAASSMFAFNVGMMSHFSGGHTSFVPFLYAPAALLVWRRAEKSWDYAVLMGVMLAWMFYEGGVYPLPHVGLLLAAETLTRAWPLRRLPRIALAGAVAIGVMFVLSAARLLPVVDQLRHHTRPLATETDHIGWDTLKLMYLDRSHGRGVPGQEYVWPEFTTYIGVGGVVLVVLGVLVSGLESAWLLALFALFFALMLGHYADWAPWSVLKHHVFPYKSMRVPSRFRLIVAMFLATFVAIGIDRLPRLFARQSRRLGEAFRTFIVGVALLSTGDAMATGAQLVANGFNGPKLTEVRASPRLYYGGADTAAFLDQPRQNRGRFDCWDEWGFTAGAPMWTGDVPQARAADEGVLVEVANRTQNTFTIDVNVSPRGGRILVNSPYDRGWRTSVGTVAEHNKLLVVDLPGGRHRVKLSYWPWGLTFGLVLSGAGLLALLAWIYRRLDDGAR
jgi:Bacterial membrane protein YfhO